MIKQVIALLILSIALVFGMHYAQQGVLFLIQIHDWISQALTDVFSGGHTGMLIKAFIALLSVPLIVGLVPAIIYWMIKRHWFPYFMEFVWVIWLIQAGALAAVYTASNLPSIVPV